MLSQVLRSAVALYRPDDPLRRPDGHRSNGLPRIIAEKKHPGELVFPAPEGGPWDAGNMRYRHWQPAVAATQHCDLHPPRTAPAAEISWTPTTATTATQWG